jgi:K+-sensing histidine kinase KdpD
VAKQKDASEPVIRLVSHDLRNPLTAVQLNAQLIERAAVREGREKEARWAGLIAAAARRMDGMIEQLVEAERLRSGHMQLALQPVALDQLLRGMLAETNADLDPRRVHLTLPEKPVVVSAERERLGRAIRGLLVLAVQEADGAAAAEVELGAKDADVCCSIHASRPADARAVSANATSASTQPDPGQGIALHFARTLIECHGGRLRTTHGDPRTIGFEILLPAQSAATSPRT